MSSTTNTKITRRNTKKVIDFNMIMAKLSEEHDIIHHVRIDDEDFIYRIIGRHEYKKILYNNNLSDLEIEDLVCQSCLLYPENYDFDSCSAGVPSLLCKEILENSFLNDIEATLRLLRHYQDEMEELENQMICIISEAFPNYSLEEIESWNNLKFCKMFSRAEWKFNNLKNAELKSVTDLIEQIVELKDEGYAPEEIEDIISNTQDEQPNYQPQPALQFNKSEDKEVSRKGKQKLTPEKLQEMQRMQELFPEINWSDDEILRNGADTAIKNTESVSTVSPALRPGWGR